MLRSVDILQITEPIQIHVLILVPAIVLGVVGGLLGAFFTRFNVWVVRNRKKMLSKIKSQNLQGFTRMLETILLVVSMVNRTLLNNCDKPSTSYCNSNCKPQTCPSSKYHDDLCIYRSSCLVSQLYFLLLSTAVLTLIMRLPRISANTCKSVEQS